MYITVHYRRISMKSLSLVKALQWSDMWWVVAAAGAAAAAWLLHWLMGSSDAARTFSRIPGPKKVPILGNVLSIIGSQVHIFSLTRKWANSFKDIYALFVTPYRVINIYNPEDIETMLSTSRFNEKSFIYQFLQPWLQDGLLLSHGPKWHARRKILTPAFHFNILRHFTQILEENSSRLVQELLPEANASQTNVVPIISAYTLHSICETAMGTKLDEGDSDQGLKYKKAIHEIGEYFLKRLTRIWLVPDLTFKLFPTGRAHDRVLGTIKSFPRHVINERRKYRETFGDDVIVEGTTANDEININTKKKRMAMLDLLLTAEKQGLIDANGIQEEVETFMFEGHDTTAAGLVFALMLLANHKEVQDKAVEEIDSIFKGSSDRVASMAELTEMKYLEACLKESMRLYPPVPSISRHIGEDVQLKDYLVPAGTLCHVQILDLHRRADLFREPLQFRPERFLSDRGDSKHPYAYIPFSAGPRNCIGQKFAMLEMKSALASVLRAYELRAVTTPDDVVFSADIVLRPHNPIYLQFVKRKLA